MYKANDKYDKRCAYHEQWVLPKKNEEVVAALNIVKDPQQQIALLVHSNCAVVFLRIVLNHIRSP